MASHGGLLIAAPHPEPSTPQLKNMAYVVCKVSLCVCVCACVRPRACVCARVRVGGWVNGCIY